MPNCASIYDPKYIRFWYSERFFSIRRISSISSMFHPVPPIKQAPSPSPAFCFLAPSSPIASHTVLFPNYMYQQHHNLQHLTTITNAPSPPPTIPPTIPPQLSQRSHEKLPCINLPLFHHSHSQGFRHHRRRHRRAHCLWIERKKRKRKRKLELALVFLRLLTLSRGQHPLRDSD